PEYGGGDESSDVNYNPDVYVSDEIGQGVVRLACSLDGLLPQVMHAPEWLAVLVVQLDVVMIDLVGRPETEDGPGADQLLVDQLAQDRLGIVEQRAGGFADHFIVEDARVLADQVPGDEERRPVDVLFQNVEVDVFQHLAAEEARLHRRVLLP